MTRITSALLVINLLSLVGCSSLTVPGPLGSAVSLETAERLTGVWWTEDSDVDEVVYARRTHENHLRVAGLEWNEESQSFEMVQHDILLGDTGEGHLFFNLPNAQWQRDDAEVNETPPLGPYAPFLVDPPTEAEPRLITLYPPNYEAWADAIDHGQLEGMVNRRDENTVEVDVLADPDVVNAFLQSHELENFFDLDEGLEIRIKNH